ncbi:MogA/MoaB family molybdenum cofactor biosynthesis protein [Halorubrum sp. SP3]|uniref:MogA/MoaB family molybdenum cofactor biosynthesis protein n=1 Tax=Halorubrum sp. SP3 TaxID=1537265 RepID=UPI0010F6D9F3|nr:MogA/MoaB family molybdenum cofactor biosynthesis protein [Halorubrum sp. SP3]TKX54760.1 MogA/MoaB family molybdenum cofactor biosynthesis protein [Halorubrum sp. SP3]
MTDRDDASDEDRHGHDHGDRHGHDHGDRHDHGHGDRHDHDHGDHHDHDVDSVGVAVVTVSTSRSADEDPAGDYVAAAFEDAGNEVVVRELIPDDYDSVQGTVDRLARRKDTDAVVTAGGTGVTPDDVTPEAVRGLFAKRLPGFGELFRRLSHEEIGTRTIGSRATAGVVSATPVFCLPGSENAVRLGVDEVILPEVGHLVGLAGRGVDEKGEKAEPDEETGSGGETEPEGGAEADPKSGEEPSESDDA